MIYLPWISLCGGNTPEKIVNAFILWRENIESEICMYLLTYTATIECSLRMMKIVELHSESEEIQQIFYTQLLGILYNNPVICWFWKYADFEVWISEVANGTKKLQSANCRFAGSGHSKSADFGVLLYFAPLFQNFEAFEIFFELRGTFEPQEM